MSELEGSISSAGSASAATSGSTTVTSSAPAASSPSQSTASPAPASATVAEKMQAIKDKSQVSADPAAVAAQPAFTPNYKFKVYDKEQEIDELFRGLIKDQDTEKKVRELHEKAYGLDVQKPKYDRLKNEFQEVNTKYTNIDKSLNQLSKYVQAGDLGSFFKAIDIPTEMVFEFAKRELEKLQAPPEQRAELIRGEEMQRRLMAIEQQNQELQHRYQTESLQARVNELETALSRPEISSVASNLDAIKGNGAFRKEVIKRGKSAFDDTGVEISVHQAVMETVADWSQIFGAHAQQGMAQMTNQSQAPASAQTVKPTLPNVGGRSTSPIKKGPRSIDDLKKLAKQFA